MDDLALIKKRLEDIPISELPGHASKSGVPFGTLRNIKYGITANPRFDTVRTLREYFLSEAA